MCVLSLPQWRCYRNFELLVWHTNVHARWRRSWWAILERFGRDDSHPYAHTQAKYYTVMMPESRYVQYLLLTKVHMDCDLVISKEQHLSKHVLQCYIHIAVFHIVCQWVGPPSVTDLYRHCQNTRHLGWWISEWYLSLEIGISDFMSQFMPSFLERSSLGYF